MYQGDILCSVYLDDEEGLFPIATTKHTFYWNACGCIQTLVQEENDFCRYCYQTLEEHEHMDPTRIKDPVIEYSIFKNSFYTLWNNATKQGFPDIYSIIEEYFRTSNKNSCHFWKYKGL